MQYFYAWKYNERGHVKLAFFLSSLYIIIYGYIMDDGEL